MSGMQEYDKAKRREYNRAYYLKHTEFCIKLCQDYYARHKEERLAYAKKYYQRKKHERKLKAETISNEDAQAES